MINSQVAKINLDLLFFPSDDRLCSNLKYRVIGLYRTLQVYGVLS